MRRLRTVVVGFGRIAAGYADDSFLAKYVPYATHAQVLVAHPAYEWAAVVEPRESALKQAVDRWRVPIVARDVDELPRDFQADVVVLATPPTSRLSILERLQGIRAVLIEKPLASNAAAAEELLRYCDRRGILLQVNFLRRADDTCRALAAGTLRAMIGTPQAIFGLYGDGLINNASHMVDLVRMFFGEVAAVQAAAATVSGDAGPLAGDSNPAFMLQMQDGVTASFQPLAFEHYRENGLDIWGERGRISILHEGVTTLFYPRRPNRTTSGAFEVASDEPSRLAVTSGTAFYRMYDNLADAIHTSARLFSPGTSALRTTQVIDAVIASGLRHGESISLVGDSAAVH